MCEYSKALHILLKSPVTDDIIKFLTDTTLRVLPSSNYPTPPCSPGGKPVARLPSLMTFITRLVRYTNVYTPTLLTAVCYLNKLKRILPKDATGLPSTIHRIFLACLILSAKFHNDSSPLNKHWAKYTDGLFTLDDINLMERQLLQLLNWDLRVDTEDLILDLQPLLEPIKQDLVRSSDQRKRIGMMMAMNKRASAGTSPIASNNRFKLYEKQRNVSIASDLSSATLVDSCNDLRRLKDVTNIPNSTRTNSNYVKSVERWNDNVNRQSWDLEQIMSQHGF
ncbi:PHO85 cyclin-1 [Saccharomyces pastorianus]|uniref:PHO85 cyclin-1 n=1 Tax=Saccharomyces pastorianus TaxID=27292 RepID=A0A6C1EF12_SACPS|nr:PCL1-like protein [Saccharomyces eubayanus]KOG96889.1 PCL1-like protein [Saccharomyces eubayanus]QID87511.1 PHO85 cyclin-1 [Saccharomyces pastorianus]